MPVYDFFINKKYYSERIEPLISDDKIIFEIYMCIYDTTMLGNLYIIK